MDQRTPEWFAARVGKVTGSRVGAILGHNPHMTREDVMRVMVREALGAPAEFTGNEATAHGEKYEAYARAWYEAHRGVKVEETGLVVHPDYPFLAASPDGLVGLDVGVEFKCPFYARKPYSVFDPKKKHYYDQCQLVMEVCGLKRMDFVVWIRDDLATIESVVSDKQWVVDNVPKLQAFFNEYESIIKDKSRHKHFVNKKAEPSREYAFVESSEMDRLWVVTQKLHQMERDMAPLQDEQKALREALFAKHGFVSNGQVRVSCVERKGSIDYDKLFADLGINELIRQRNLDLDAYRRPANFAYKVTLED